jgi:twinkle protein
MGKSEWMDALMINMIQDYSWKFGVFSAENFPVKHHLLKLVGKFSGDAFWGDNKMSEETARNSMAVMDDYIKFIGTQDDNITIESILDQARILNFRYGLNGLIIDPWNTIEHKIRQGETETNYVSRVLSLLSAFAKINELHIWIVAHPRKMEMDNNRKPVVPTPYDISGSANFYNRPENCITIHRHKNEESDYVGVHVHKVRFQYKNGRPGKGKLSYDVKNGRYYEHQEEFKEALFG